MAEVAFQHVAKVYPDGTRAVDDLTLEVGDGEFVVIVGPSGSGKTTALRMVAGLEEISEGTISIGGRVAAVCAAPKLYARPANAFVGGFIGSPSMNLLEGTIRRSNGDVSVLLGNQKLALDASVFQQRPRLSQYDHKELIVGIRPESIHDATLVPTAAPYDPTAHARQRRATRVHHDHSGPGPRAPPGH